MKNNQIQEYNDGLTAEQRAELREKARQTKLWVDQMPRKRFSKAAEEARTKAEEARFKRGIY